MGTEVAVSFTNLRAQLENEKTSLYKLDENIKKIVQTGGRFHNDRFNASGEYNRGGNRIGGRNTYPDGSGNYNKNDGFAKKKQETKTVFSRLSARTADSDGEEEGPAAKKSRRVSSAVTRDLPTRASVLRAQGGDEQARTRNRRIFGSLLGTLQKFKQEEITLQTKEDKKAQVERKIEEQARLEKEREQKERKTLFAEREHKKATIKALEAKMARVQEFERWETSQKHLGNFILTKSKPHIYWLPKKIEDKANEKLNTSREFHEKHMSSKRAELQDELARIEARCLAVRVRGHHAHPPHAPHAPHAKENHALDHKTLTDSQDVEDNTEEGGGRKRDKFAADRDDVEHEESDGEHDVEHPQLQDELKEGEGDLDNSIDTQPDTKMDTTEPKHEESEEVKVDAPQEPPQEVVEEAPEAAPQMDTTTDTTFFNTDADVKIPFLS